MANKDHSLDQGIIDAAFREFTEHGFEKASMRKIAANANVTVGAIYTRYPTKDALFISLVAPLLERIATGFEEIRKGYEHVSVTDPKKGAAQLIDAMGMESEAILHLLFDDYDRAKLLLTKSRGSSLEHFFDEIVDRKITETVAFFEAGGLPHPKPEILRLMVSGQFHMYFEIMEEGCELETAREMMKAAVCYHTGGWYALLGLTKKED